jgi:hypothetical protein
MKVARNASGKILKGENSDLSHLIRSRVSLFLVSYHNRATQNKHNSSEQKRAPWQKTLAQDILRVAQILHIRLSSGTGSMAKREMFPVKNA